MVKADQMVKLGQYLRRQPAVNNKNFSGPRKVCAIVISALWAATATSAFAELKVITTLPLYADVVTKIGGDRVKAESIIPPKKGFAFYQESPDDVTRLRSADLLVHSGLGVETWLPRLVEKSGKADFSHKGSKQLGLSTGLPLLQTPEQLMIEEKESPYERGNPFFALSPRLGLMVATSIANKLSTIDPQGEATYKNNLAALKGDLEPKIAAWTAAVSSAKGKKLVGYKFEGVYLADFLGLSLKDAVIEERVERPSVSQMQNIIKLMGLYKIPAIIRTETSSKEITDEIARATSAKAVTICENVGDLPACSDYPALLAYNVDVVTKAVVGK